MPTAIRLAHRMTDKMSARFAEFIHHSDDVGGSLCLTIQRRIGGVSLNP